MKHCERLLKKLILPLTAFFFISCDVAMVTSLNTIKEELEEGPLSTEYRFYTQNPDEYPSSQYTTFNLKIGQTYKISDFSVPTLEGYSFTGWSFFKNPLTYSYESPENFVFDSEGFVQSILVTPQPAYLVANWSNKNTVTYVVNHYIQKVSNGNVLDEYELYESENFTTYEGEFTQVTAKNYDNFKARSFENVLADKNGIEINIYYDAIIYTVTFDYNYNSIADEVTVLSGTTVAEKTITRDEYTFAGWYTDSELTCPYDFNSLVQTNLTLYALWNKTVSTYTVNHYKQDISNTSIYNLEDTEKLTGTIGELTSASAKNYTGYTCSGITQVVLQESGTNIDIYYYRNSYAVTLYIKKGTEIAVAEKYLYPLYLSTLELKDYESEIANYTFEGWFTDEDCTNPYTQNSLTVTEDISLYAYYCENITLTFAVQVNVDTSDINVTVAPGTQIEDKIVFTATDGQITFTADDGYSSYTWKIDDKEQIETSRTLSLYVSTWLLGVYDLSLTAIKDETAYSYNAQILVGSN